VATPVQWLRDAGRALGQARPPRARLLAALAGTLAVYALVGGLVWAERERQFTEGQRNGERLVRALAAMTSRAVEAVDLTLVGMADLVRVTPELQEHDPRFETALRRKKAGLPFVRALFVIGPDGFITQDTDHPHTPRVGLADRGYFRAHLADPELGLYVGPPLVSRSAGRWFVSLSRRVDGPGGELAGVAVAALEPRYFEQFYQALQLGPGDSISLFQRDGVLVARHPHHETAVGKSFAHLDLFSVRLPSSPSGSYQATSLAHGVPILVSYRALEGQPLLVSVALDREALLTGWRRGAGATIAATALLTALAAVIAGVRVRQARVRREAHERNLQEQRLETLGRMTGGVAHDFGNLFAVIGTSLRRLEPADERSRPPVQLALRAVVQGGRLASQLLAFARRQELRLETCDANRLLVDLERLLQQAASTTTQVRLDLAPDLWPCRVDETQFAAALVNLVVNAREAIRDGGGRVRITTTNHRAASGPPNGGLPAGDYVRITVVDNGTGMTAHVASRATEPFFSTKARGSGLGLSQVHGLARQTGGGLLIETTLGAGTSVHLFLPRATDAGSAPAVSDVA
jgi:signal transduction histidine kinase